MLAASTTLRQVSTSVRTKAANSAGGMAAGWKPMRCSVSTMAGRVMMPPTSVAIRARIGSGVPGGAIMPYQLEMSKPGTALPTEGVCGDASQVAAELTARSRNCPCWTIGQAEVSEKKTSTLPAMRSVSAGPVPR